MTKLTSPVRRETNTQYGNRRVVVILSPSSKDDLIAFRLAGKRTQYVTRVADLYRLAALWHGQKEATARRQARRQGIPWRFAVKQFVADNRVRETGKKGN